MWTERQSSEWGEKKRAALVVLAELVTALGAIVEDGCAFIC